MKRIKCACFALLFVLMVFMLAGCGAKRINNMTLKGLPNVVLINEKLDTSNTTAIVQYNDNTTMEVTNDQLIFGEIDTSTLGRKTITVAYKDFSVAYDVYVSTNSNEVQMITDYEKPSFITEYNGIIKKNQSVPTDEDEAESQFFSLNDYYLVGDDNAFKFKLDLTCIDENGDEISINSYQSDSKLYMIDSEGMTELTGKDLARYCEISAKDSEFNFTEEAVGKVFKLATKPKYLVEDNEGKYVEFVVKVVDGYNIYSEDEFSLIDNSQSFWIPFKQAKGLPTALDMNAIILHKNFVLQDDNLPECCFYGENRTGGIIESDSASDEANSSLNEHYSLYRHTNKDYQQFRIYGNHFTVDFSRISKIPEDKYGSNFSNLHLLKFIGANIEADVSKNIAGVKNNSYASIQDCIFIGNAKSTNDEGEPLTEEELKESLGGLIFAKVNLENFDLKNCIIRSCFISLFPEYTTYYTAIDCKIYESLQNGIFIWRNGQLTLKNTIIERCGGPLAICQHDQSSRDVNNLNSPNIIVDGECKLEANLSGQEPWFAAVNMSQVVPQFTALSNGFRDVSVGLDQALKAKITGQDYTYEQAIANKLSYLGSDITLNQNKTVQLLNNDSKLNMIAVLMSGGFDLTPSSITGKISIGDNMPLDKNDENSAVFDGTLKNAICIDSGKLCIYTDTKDFYIVTKTMNSDGTYSYNPTNISISDFICNQITTVLTSNEKAECEAAVTNLNDLMSMFDDKVANIYYSGVGIVLGINDYIAE